MANEKRPLFSLVPPSAPDTSAASLVVSAPTQEPTPEAESTAGIIADDLLELARFAAYAITKLEARAGAADAARIEEYKKAIAYLEHLATNDDALERAASTQALLDAVQRNYPDSKRVAAIMRLWQARQGSSDKYEEFRSHDHDIQAAAESVVETGLEHMEDRELIELVTRIGIGGIHCRRNPYDSQLDGYKKYAGYQDTFQDPPRVKPGAPIQYVHRDDHVERRVGEAILVRDLMPAAGVHEAIGYSGVFSGGDYRYSKDDTPMPPPPHSYGAIANDSMPRQYKKEPGRAIYYYAVGTDQQMYKHTQSRGGQHLLVEIILPESVAGEVMKRVGQNPLLIRGVVESYISTLGAGAAEWHTGRGIDYPLRPPYEQWDAADGVARFYINDTVHDRSPRTLEVRGLRPPWKKEIDPSRIREVKMHT